LSTSAGTRSESEFSSAGPYDPTSRSTPCNAVCERERARERALSVCVRERA